MEKEGAGEGVRDEAGVGEGVGGGTGEGVGDRVEKVSNEMVEKVSNKMGGVLFCLTKQQMQTIWQHFRGYPVLQEFRLPKNFHPSHWNKESSLCWINESGKMRFSRKTQNHKNENKHSRIQ